MSEIVKLKYHRKRCNTCHHYKITELGSDCNHPQKGRTLSLAGQDSYIDYARYCSDWLRKEGYDERIRNTAGLG